jgi:hypothetical protein
MVAIAADNELVHEVYKATNITGGGPHCINHGVDIPRLVQDFGPSTVRIFFLAEGTLARRFDPQNMVVLSKNNDQMKGESLSDPTYWWMK